MNFGEKKSATWFSENSSVLVGVCIPIFKRPGVFICSVKACYPKSRSGPNQPQNLKLRHCIVHIWHQGSKFLIYPFWKGVCFPKDLMTWVRFASSNVFLSKYDILLLNVAEPLRECMQAQCIAWNFPMLKLCADWLLPKLPYQSLALPDWSTILNNFRQRRKIFLHNPLEFNFGKLDATLVQNSEACKKRFCFVTLSDISYFMFHEENMKRVENGKLFNVDIL